MKQKAPSLVPSKIWRLPICPKQNICRYHFPNVWVCSLVDKALDQALDSISKRSRFDSHCLSCAEVLGKHLNSYCFCLHNRSWYIITRLPKTTSSQSSNITHLTNTDSSPSALSKTFTIMGPHWNNYGSLGSTKRQTLKSSVAATDGCKSPEAQSIESKSLAHREPQSNGSPRPP